jgi:outer membrane protein OmpA-like peptidoglycan-associated protein
MKKLLKLCLYTGLLGILQTSEAQIPLEDNVVIVKNEPFINSDKLEFSPSFFEEGIVFISTKVAAPEYNIKDKNIGKTIMSIFKATRDAEGVLRKPEVFATELLSESHEGPLTFDRTNEMVYFSRNIEDKGDYEIRKMDVFVAERLGDGWGNIRSLPFNDPNADDCHPTISVENDAIYFASDREGGYGGMDIWVTKRIGNEWSDPMNLGPQVNSKGNEVFPYMHADGTLYFASTSYGGLGGLDLFYCVRAGEGWTIPLNLGKPFNSEKDDIGFIVDRDNRNGYFSSNRKGGFGGDDIYSFNIESDSTGAKKSPKKELAVDLKDSETGEDLEGVTMSYINLDGYTVGEAIAGKNGEDGILNFVPGEDGLSYQLQFGQASELQRDSTGKIIIPTGNTVIKVEKEGYQPKYVQVTPEVFEQGLQIEMDKAVDCVQFIGTVYGEDRVSLQSGVKVIVTDLATGKQMTLVSDPNGNVNYCLPCNKVFNLMASRDGSVNAVNTITTKPCKAGETLRASLFIEGNGNPLVEGTVIQLPNIYFNFNDAALRPDATIDLDALVTLLNIYPDMVIELASHTDSRGTDRFNKELSQRRSDNTRQYLIEQGIADERLIAVGYGESDVRNRCVDGVKCSEAEHQENRRTEVIIKKIGNPIEEMEEPTYAGNYQEQGNDMPEQEYSNPEETGGDENYTSWTGSGSFLVIAGTFSKPANAIQRLEELKALGFTDAEIVQFNTSPFQAVCVGKFTSDPEAQSLLQTLQSQYKIEAYVREMGDEVYR